MTGRESQEPSAAAADPAAAAARARALGLIGRVVAERYRIDSILAMGGMGAVFRGEHVHMRKRVAVKVLHPSTQGFPELVTRFERESIVGAHISHPNVTSASDFGRLEDGSCYLVLEFVEGTTLHDLIHQGPIPADRAANIARQVACALEAAHSLEICHRDVKPRNIMVVEGKPDRVKLIDFGLARVPVQRFSGETSEQISVTTAGTVFGTVAYMAPETARGMQAVTFRSDLYALGIIMYEMLTGKHPYDETEPTALFLKHRTEKPRPFRVRAPGVAVPAELEAIVMKLLEKAPENRYPDAGALIEAIDEAMGPPLISFRTGDDGPRSSERSLGPRSRPTTGSGAESPASKSRPSMSIEEASAPASALTGPGPTAKRRSVLPWFLLIAAGVGGAAYYYRFMQQGTPTGASTPSATASARAASPSGATSVAVAAASGKPATAPSTSDSAAAGSAPRGGVLDGLDAASWRGVLKEAAASKDAGRGAKAFLALLQIDPDAYHEPDIVGAAAATAVAVELGDRTSADSVFNALASPAMGSGGPDILFHMLSFYGGSRGAKRGEAILRRPEVLQRATPALRIVLAIRDAPCKDRGALFERAAADGDQRTLGILSAMQAPDCDLAGGACCAPYDTKLAVTVAQLRLRLRPQ